MSKQEPVAHVTGFYQGHCIIEPTDRATVLPVGMALYRAPREWVFENAVDVGLRTQHVMKLTTS